MPHCATDDGVKLFYEEVGRGESLLLVHEFAGDYRSYELQVARRRPSLYSPAMADRIRQLNVPVLVVCGDEDAPCLEPSIFLKRTIPAALLAVLPGTGHTVNLEEPSAFNALVGDFLTRVRTGKSRTWAGSVQGTMGSTAESGVGRAVRVHRGGSRNQKGEEHG